MLPSRPFVRRPLLVVAIISLWSGGLWLGCSDDKPAQSYPDVGVAPPVDAATGVDVDAQGYSCSVFDGGGGVSPTGTKIVDSPRPYALGIASDALDGSVNPSEYAIYEDIAFANIYAIPLSGGTPEQIGPSWSYTTTTNVYITGPVVAYWAGVDLTMLPASYGYIGQLTVWTGATKTHLLSGSSATNLLAISNDGHHIAYSDNAQVVAADAGTPDAGDAGGVNVVATTDIVISAPDGSGKQTVVPNFSWDANCPPAIGFLGDVLLLGTCVTGTQTFTLQAYRSPGWSATTINPGLPATTFLGSDDNTLLYLTSGSTLTAQEVAAGSPPVQMAPNVSSAFLTHDGTAVIYLTSDGSISRSPLASWTPVSVSAGPYVSLNSLSKDDKWLTVSKSASYSSSSYLYLSDDYLLPTAKDSTPTALVHTDNGQPVGDSFTADNAHVFFGANAKSSGVDLVSVPLAAVVLDGGTDAGPQPTLVAKTVVSALASTGSHVVVSSAYDPAFSTGRSTADISLADLAILGKPKTLVSRADYFFSLNPMRTKLLYSWYYCADQRAGLYVVDLP